jgi:hypothetical protein
VCRLNNVMTIYHYYNLFPGNALGFLLICIETQRLHSHPKQASPKHGIYVLLSIQVLSSVENLLAELFFSSHWMSAHTLPAQMFMPVFTFIFYVTIFPISLYLLSLSYVYLVPFTYQYTLHSFKHISEN